MGVCSSGGRAGGHSGPAARCATCCSTAGPSSGSNTRPGCGAAGAVASAAMLFMRARHRPTERAMRWPDAAGPGPVHPPAARSGAAGCDMPAIVAMLMGVVTAASFGGVLRDVVLQRDPQRLQRPPALRRVLVLQRLGAGNRLQAGRRRAGPRPMGPAAAVAPQVRAGWRWPPAGRCRSGRPGTPRGTGAAGEQSRAADARRRPPPPPPRPQRRPQPCRARCCAVGAGEGAGRGAATHRALPAAAPARALPARSRPTSPRWRA